MEKKKVLICEDDEFLREIYVEIIGDGGYDIDTAVDGEEAYEKIKKGGYDLVLLDIIMPKMNGLDLMTKMKTDPDYKPSKALVFLTNLDNDDQVIQAMKLGNGYLIKSQLSPENLLDEIGKYINK